MANILIVDDSKLMRTAISNTIAKIGHKVIGEAKNGLEGIEKYRELSPDIVLLDVNMPGICGIETAKRVTAEHAEAKIVMVSARGEYDLITQALINGAKSYISKPVGIDNLKETIESLVQAQNSSSRVLIADSSVVFRKIIKDAIAKLNIKDIVEAKDSLEVVVKIEKNPSLDLIILSEELLGLPSKNLLTILKKRDLIKSKKFIFMHSGGAVLEVPKKMNFLGTIDKSENTDELQIEFEKLLDPKPLDHPQFLLAFNIANVYLSNNANRQIDSPKLMRIVNRYFDTDEELSDEDLFSSLEYIIDEYMHNEDDAHKLKRLELRELLDINSDDEQFLITVPSEDVVEPESPFEDDSAKEQFLSENKTIPTDIDAVQVARKLFDKIIAFANSTTDEIYIHKKINISWQNLSDLMNIIQKNPRLIPSRYLLGLKPDFYSYLHSIASEIDQPILYEIEDKLVTIEKIKSRINKIVELGSKTLFDRYFLPMQPTFWHLEKVASAEVVEPFLEEQQSHFKKALIECVTLSRKLLLSLENLYANIFYNRLLDLARRNSKITSKLIAGKVNPDLQIYQAIEFITARDKSIEDSESLLAKAKQISTRHFVLASSNIEITEQFKTVINKTNSEWKFNRIADANILLKWLQGNHPTHLLLDIKLFEVEAQPSINEFLSEINSFKSYFKIVILLPSEYENKEIYMDRFRDIVYPIEPTVLSKRVMQL